MERQVMVSAENRREMTRPAVPWRPVALPVEHGGWSFLLEPVILGLALSPSLPAVCLGLTALAAFLTRHPLRLLALDYKKGARYPRTALAERFVLGYAVTALVFAFMALAGSEGSLLPVVLTATPLALAALSLDLTGRGREALAELAGSVALGGSAAAIVIAGGGSSEIAWMAWLLQSLRAITAILYVRARLRHERGGDASLPSVLSAHALAVAVSAALVMTGRAPVLAVIAFAILMMRAAWGLARPATGVRPQMVGVQEVSFGILTLALIVVGFRNGV